MEGIIRSDDSKRMHCRLQRSRCTGSMRTELLLTRHVSGTYREQASSPDLFGKVLPSLACNSTYLSIFQGPTAIAVARQTQSDRRHFLGLKCLLCWLKIAQCGQFMA